MCALPLWCSTFNLSPWSNADPGRSIDNDSEWSSADQSDDTEHSTDGEPPSRKGKERMKLPSKKAKGKAQRYDQRKKAASKSKKRFSSQLHVDSEDDSERPHRRTQYKKPFEDSSSSDSESPRSRNRTSKQKVRGKAKDNGSSKSKGKPVAPKNNQHGHTRCPLDESSHAASPSRGQPSRSCPYKGCIDLRENRPRSTPYRYTGSQLLSVAQSESFRPP